MTPEEQVDLESLAGQVCPHTYRGLPCDKPAGHDGFHWHTETNGVQAWGLDYLAP